MHERPEGAWRVPLAVRDRRQRLTGQAGFGLIEVVVTILLASLVVLGLAAGLLTLVRTTKSNDERQQVQLALGNFSESVRGMDYLDCATSPNGASAGDYQPAYDAGLANWHPELVGMSSRIVDVEYWEGPVRPAVRRDLPSGADLGAQQLTLEVTYLARNRTDGADREAATDEPSPSSHASTDRRHPTEGSSGVDPDRAADGGRRQRDHPDSHDGVGGRRHPAATGHPRRAGAQRRHRPVGCLPARGCRDLGSGRCRRCRPHRPRRDAGQLGEDCLSGEEGTVAATWCCRCSHSGPTR